jgi:hypothetical protein
MGIKVYEDKDELGYVIAVDTDRNMATVLQTDKPSADDWTPDFVASYVWIPADRSPALEWLKQIDGQEPMFEVQP